ncbi:MAG: NAD(+) diphosphatase [Deltaproteobacteria bacterium]|nr:NAD(+) diphosphatase [Candidatus Anaeroferrophillacea bacterium]
MPAGKGNGTGTVVFAPAAGAGSVVAVPGGIVDRAAGLRADAERLRRRLAEPCSRVVPVWNGRCLFRAADDHWAVFLAGGEAGSVGMGAGTAPVIFLGIDGAGRAWFAGALGDAPEGGPPLAGRGVFGSLRRRLALLTPADAGILSYAAAMVHWHEHCRFCGRCGSPTVSEDGGHQRRCTGRECGLEHFPRTDPAVIVRVERDGHCLLARQSAWSPGLYSVLAGFVEPGEALEQAVVREVREEAGIGVDQVVYAGSQPWPFPRSLMVGFTARTADSAVACADGELEDVRWFTRDEVAAGLAAGSLRLPAPGTMSHHLIAGWYDRRGEPSLARIIAGRREAR